MTQNRKSAHTGDFQTIRQIGVKNYEIHGFHFPFLNYKIKNNSLF